MEGFRPVSIDTRERQKMMLESYARQLEQFRQRWKPTGIDAAYHEADFQHQLTTLLHYATDLARQPVLDVLHSAAAAGFCAAPMPVFTLNKEDGK